MSDALKEEFVGNRVMEKHAFFVHLPTWLSPLFGPISPEQLEQLTASSYFYFRFVLAIDHLLDAAPAAGGGSAAATERLLGFCELYERAVRGLVGLFPGNDPFWDSLAACKGQYARSNVHEKEFGALRGPFTREAFEALAADKSAVCNAVVYALSRLGGTDAPVAALLNCLNHVHVAFQCMDDVEDFSLDWDQGQYTYAHALVESHLEAAAIDARALDGARVHPYLYTSGVADALYGLGQEHYAQGILIARSLGLGPLADLLNHYSDRMGFYRRDIAAKLARAGQGVAPALDTALITG